jgi:hypothetical protein
MLEMKKELKKAALKDVTSSSAGSMRHSADAD